MAKPGLEVVQLAKSLNVDLSATKGPKSGLSRFDQIMSQMNDQTRSHSARAPQKAEAIAPSIKNDPSRKVGMVEQSRIMKTILQSPAANIRTIAANDIVASPTKATEIEQTKNSTGAADHFLDFIKDLNDDQLTMDNILQVSLTNTKLSTNELLALQAGAYRFTQEMEIASKMLEQALKGINQAMNTQIG